MGHAAAECQSHRGGEEAYCTDVRYSGAAGLPQAIRNRSMKKTIIALALGALTLGGAAQAQIGEKVRQLNQERRIDAGQRSGKLTHREAARLDREQKSIKRDEAYLKARHGGHLTKRDKMHIKQRQNAANHHILRKKHNAMRGKNHLKL